ncbi:hypothetical protein [Legionella erythra]|uniref:Uncharacterized protein n=1 Tax=Legionella erythra TaxID=448 RepID=A0A0W0TEQ8_LEGER|nr:hypothetical protein [Legionella erythra]KTC94062.1 hypothetical protein Lery_2229 [Legionella erythra]
MSLVFEKYYEKLNPTPLFYVFGNNDSPQRDYGPFRSGDKSAYRLFGSINGLGDLYPLLSHAPFMGRLVSQKKILTKGITVLTWVII